MRIPNPVSRERLAPRGPASANGTPNANANELTFALSRVDEGDAMARARTEYVEGMRARALRFDSTPREDHFVLLRDSSWADYERLLEKRGESSVPRITYLEGTIEVMTPSLTHERITSIIGRLVEVYCIENGIECTALRSWTLKSKRKQGGAEPDECYVFGTFARPPRVPALAIEVEWTYGRIDKLDVYKKLGVREVWYWREGRVDPYELRRGRYVRLSKSGMLPGIDLSEVAKLTRDPRPMTTVMSAYGAALRRKRR
jgi:Uma2 family endonuclease